MKGLGAKGPVAIVGYTFDGAWAARNRSAVDRFLDAARQAKQILAVVRSRMAAACAAHPCDATPMRLRSTASATAKASCAGRSTEEEADARALYRVLAEIGGTELVGPARELAAGTFYRPAKSSIEGSELGRQARLARAADRRLVRGLAARGRRGCFRTRKRWRWRSSMKRARARSPSISA